MGCKEKFSESFELFRKKTSYIAGYRLLLVYTVPWFEGPLWISPSQPNPGYGVRLHSLSTHWHELCQREWSLFCPTPKGHLRTDKEVKTSLQWLHSVPCWVRKTSSHWRWLKMFLTFLESKWQWHRNSGQTAACTVPAGIHDPDTIHCVISAYSCVHLSLWQNAQAQATQSPRYQEIMVFQEQWA